VTTSAVSSEVVAGEEFDALARLRRNRLGRRVDGAFECGPGVALEVRGIVRTASSTTALIGSWFASAFSRTSWSVTSLSVFQTS